MFKQTRGLTKTLARWIHTESQFLQAWKTTSNDLLNKLEKEFIDHPKVEDLEGNDQLLKIVLNDGKTFVVNRQTSKFEIWYSSPISGPSHFRFDEGSKQWINKYDKELYALIFEDLKSLLK